MQRYPGLDLLRAIAILWVLLFHGVVAGIYSPVPAVARWGWMGVDLFFVLSGYLIGSQLLRTCAAGTKLAIGQFYWRRALRILPAYLVVVSCYFALPGFRETSDIQPLWQFLTFTENLLIDYSRDKAFSHVWSLCVEEHFYLLFPVLVWWLRRRSSWRTTASVCAVVLVGGMFLRGYVRLHGLGAGPEVTGDPSFRSALYFQKIYYPSYMRLDGLLAGVVLAAMKWFRPAIWRKWMNLGDLLLVLGLAGIAGAIWTFQDRFDFWPTVLGYPLLALGLASIVAAGVSPHCVIGNLRVPGAKGVATIAFSLYLSHKMTWQIGQRYLSGLVAGDSLERFLLFGLAAFVVGTLLYWVVERPFLLLRDRIDAWFESKSAAAQQGVETVPILTGLAEETERN